MAETGLGRLERELIDLVNEDVRRWQRIAQDLIRVEREELWRDAAPPCSSFSMWVRTVAVRAKVHESNLWRALGAGRVYLKIRERKPDLPDLGDFEAKVSPENIELVEKISRAAPPDIVDRLVEKTFAGEVSRGELRRIWDTYRPAIAGRTARERTAKGEDPVVPSASDEERVTAATILTAIREGVERGLLSEAAPLRCRDFSEVAVRPGTTRHARRIDQVVAYRENELSRLTLAGIEVKVTKSDLEGDTKTMEYADYVDTLWFAVPYGLADLALSLVPRWVGILVLVLTLEGTAMEVLRPADAAGHDRARKADLRGETAMEILGRII